MWMHSDSYRMLVMIREFDDRFGFAKWGFRTCAEWLAWRCGFSPSAAREKVRAAHALRTLPAISAAFSDGRLSYSKARALTRVAYEQNEDLLLAYTLQATAAQVEERCRQMRNSASESTHVARNVWERRSLTVSRSLARGTVVINIELPAEDGELVAPAIDSAVAAGEAAIGIEFDGDREAGEGAKSQWRAQQADALVAIMRVISAGMRQKSAPLPRTTINAMTAVASAAKPRALIRPPHQHAAKMLPRKRVALQGETRSESRARCSGWRVDARQVRRFFTATARSPLDVT